MRSRNESSSNEISQLEMMLREHRDRETDQTEALKAKDSQVRYHYTKLFSLAKSFISYFALPKCIAEHIAHLSFNTVRTH